jgi:hypothetical protein
MSAQELILEIRKIQMNRKVSQQRHNAVVSRLEHRFDIAQSKLQTIAESQRRKSRSIYADVLQEVLGPYRASEEARLAEVSHYIEMNERSLELMVQQYRLQTDCLVSDINDLEAERRDIQQKHESKYASLVEEIARLTNALESMSKANHGLVHEKEQRRRSSCAASRRGSLVNSIPGFRQFSSMFLTENCDEEDANSVISDLSTSVASIHSSFAGKSVSTSETMSSRLDICPRVEVKSYTTVVPEEERFTVIKL